MAQSAFPGPYTDPNITTRGPYDQESTAVDPKPNRNDLGRTKVYDVEGTNQDPGDQGAVPPAHAGMVTWVIGRDRYANDGSPGQEYLENQG